MRLICGIDFTDGNRSPAVFAGRLSAALGANLTLAHFVPQSAAFPAPAIGREVPRDEVLSAVGDRVGEAVAMRRGDANGLVGFGDPAKQLLALAGDEPSAMIVVGSRGRGPAKAALLGSVSRRVVAKARCPVTVVPSQAGAEERLAETDTIVVGQDDSSEARTALLWAAACASKLSARLVAVEVVESPAVGYRPGVGVGPLPRSSRVKRSSSNLRNLEAARLMPSGVPIEFVQVEGPPAHRIAAVADRADAGLIAVGSRGRGSIGEMLLGSTSSMLVCASSRPVMICARRAIRPDPASDGGSPLDELL